MRRISTATRLALTSSTFAIAASFAGSASAKAAPVDTTTAAPVTNVTAQDVQNLPANSSVQQVAGATSGITVTGTRIRRPNLDSPVPVTSVNQEQFFETGKVAIGETLNELPQLRPSNGQQNSINVGLGNVGLNLLDLRGLGTQRTLVLVNGRRHVGSDIYGNATSPDVNTIPTALIDRVDVVTGGSSAVYGSDAIAGVVNFILKRSFEGIDVRGQAGISEYNDAESFFASATVGKNFAQGRGNVALSAEWGRRNAYYGDARPCIGYACGFLTVDTDPSGTPNGSDGNPDRLFFQDIRNAATSNTGTVIFGFGSGGPTAAFNCGTDPIGVRYTCPYIFTQDGTLVPQTGTRVSLGPNGSFIGGNGDSFRDKQQIELSPKLDRYIVNAIGHFTVNEAFEPFFEAKWARTDTRGQGNSGPAFIISAGNKGDIRQMPRIDNPFLSSQARSLITSTLLTSGRGTGTIGGAANPVTAADVIAINNGSYRFRLNESFFGLPTRVYLDKRDTYRGVVGVRGTFNGDWSYEVSANYGDFQEHQTLLGNYNRQRFLLAMDSTRDSTGKVVCRSQIDPTAAVGLAGAGTGLTQAQRDAILAADVAACVPFNPFGNQITPQMANYVVQPTKAHGEIKQFVLNGFVSGDTSGFLNLPGGPIGFAAGAEYRRETNSFAADTLVREGYTFFNPVADIDAPAFKVKEVFGELRVPILKDQPFFHSLEVNGAARYADYSGKTGGVWAYNAGAEWSPIVDLKLRGNFARAVRAPLISELYAKQVLGFTTIGNNDPCALRNRGDGSPTRAANCKALGVPDAFDYVYTSSLLARFGGNPDLHEETSNSWTLGGILQPRLIPGLSVSVDYYNIKVNQVITSVSTLQILQLCVDAPTITNPFCGLFQRNQGPGPGPLGEEPGRVLEGSLLVSTLNFAALKDRGIDTEINYRHRFGGLGLLDLTLDYTHLFQRSAYTDPSNPKFEDVFLGELGNPVDRARFRANLKRGALNFTYTLDFIGKQYINTYEDYNSVNGNPPQNADYAIIRSYPSVFYHGARIGWDILKRYELYAGVENITGKLPPYGATGIAVNTIGGTTGIYDNRGRFFYGGVRAHF